MFVTSHQTALNSPFLFCSAACNTRNAPFTMAPHPDVGEGASPQMAQPLRAFLFLLPKPSARSRASTPRGFPAPLTQGALPPSPSRA